MIPQPPISTLFPYTTLFRSHRVIDNFMIQGGDPTGTGSGGPGYRFWDEADNGIRHGKGSLSMANTIVCFIPKDRKSTRLNSSHVRISYAVFCLKKKKSNIQV